MATPTVDVARWDDAHARTPSPTLDAITRRFLTGCLPDDVRPTTTWPAWPVEALAAALRVDPGARVLDVGCGRADITIAVARVSQAAVVGVDPSLVGLGLARARHRCEPDMDVAFLAGHFTELGVAVGAFDAVLLVDAFHFAADQAAALSSLAATLRPGGRLVMTFPEPRDRPVSDDVFAAAGLGSIERDTTPDWEARFVGFYAALHEARQQLIAELGEAATAEVVRDGYVERSRQVRHVMVRAIRTG